MTLFCEGQKVGTVKFDLISYIGKKSQLEKIYITSESTGPEEKALVGDSNTYPGAYVTFKIKVEPLDKHEASPGSGNLLKGKS